MGSQKKYVVCQVCGVSLSDRKGKVFYCSPEHRLQARRIKEKIYNHKYHLKRQQARKQQANV